MPAFDIESVAALSCSILISQITLLTVATAVSECATLPYGSHMPFTRVAGIGSRVYRYKPRPALTEAQAAPPLLDKDVMWHI